MTSSNPLKNIIENNFHSKGDNDFFHQKEIKKQEIFFDAIESRVILYMI